MAPSGGLRDRLIDLAVRRTAKDVLEALGWLDTVGRQHEPLVIRWELPAAERDKIELAWNTLDCVYLDISDAALELGSLLTEDTHVFDFDFYAEDEAIGRHVIGDLRDAFRGQYPTIGRTTTVIPVFDWTQTPTPLEPEFYVEVERVVTDRATNTSQPWERHLHSLRVEILDER